MAGSVQTIDYRGFHISRINEPQFKHLRWLLFWPLYWLSYPVIEKLNPAAEYTTIYCPLDDLVPFQEWFLIPYMLWMVCMVGMCLYCLRYDRDTFCRYSKFLTVSMSISTVVFLVFPSCQELRPEVFPRDNFMSRLVGLLYAADTNTNVFPSEHVIGSIAVWITAHRANGLHKSWRSKAIGLFMILVSLSTVFLKQHSILDVVAAIPVCGFCYFLCFRKKSVPQAQ